MDRSAFAPGLSLEVYDINPRTKVRTPRSAVDAACDGEPLNRGYPPCRCGSRRCPDRGTVDVPGGPYVIPGSRA